MDDQTRCQPIKPIYARLVTQSAEHAAAAAVVGSLGPLTWLSWLGAMVVGLLFFAGNGWYQHRSWWLKGGRETHFEDVDAITNMPNMSAHNQLGGSYQVGTQFFARTAWPVESASRRVCGDCAVLLGTVPRRADTSLHMLRTPSRCCQGCVQTLLLFNASPQAPSRSRSSELTVALLVCRLLC